MNGTNTISSYIRVCVCISAKKVADKKKNKGKNAKTAGRGGSNLQLADGRVKMEACASATDFNDPNAGEGTDSAPEEHVDLFFDWCTVSQLVNYFGNPTIYTIKGKRMVESSRRRG